MSQHNDITIHCLSLAIKKDFTKEECLDNLNNLLSIAGYEEDMECPDYDLRRWVELYLLSQKDGLCGVSHWKIKDWLRRRD